MTNPSDFSIFLRHGDALRRFARTLVLDESQAQDLVQETWVTALTHNPESKGRVFAWMKKVMLHHAMRERRANERRRKRESASAKTSPIDSAASIAQDLEAHRQLADAMASLEEPLRSAIVLYYIKGLSLTEISSFSQCQKSTVKTRLHRAREQLRSRLQRKYGADWSAIIVPASSALTLKSTSIATASGVFIVNAKFWTGISMAALVALAGSVLLMQQDEASSPQSKSLSESLDKGGAEEGGPVAQRSLQVPANPLSTVSVGLPDGDNAALSRENWTLLESRVSSVIHGRVVDESGSPVPSAVVGVFDWAEGDRTGDALDSQQCDRDGAYSLRCTMVGPMLVIASCRASERQSLSDEGALAWHVESSLNLLPASLILSVSQSESVDLEPLVLTPGVTITGNVWLLGEPYEGILEASSASELTGPSWRLQVVNAEVIYVEGRVFPYGVLAESNASGSFEIRGLAPGPTQVCVVGGSRDVFHDRTARTCVDVRAPCTGVDIELELTRLRAVVCLDGVPTPGADVTVSAGSIVVRPTNSDGVAEFMIGAEGEFRVSVSLDGYEEAVASFTPNGFDAVEELKFDLEIRRARPSLRIRVNTTDRGDLRELSVQFKSDRSGRLVRRHERVTNGECVIPDLEPGKYTIEARLGASRLGSSGFYLPVVGVIEIPVLGETEHSIYPVMGGRIQVVFRNERGAQLSPTCRLLNVNLEPIDIKFSSQWSGGSEMGSRPNAQRPSEVEPALKEGHYELRVDLEGYESRRIPIEVRAGATVDVDVTLASIAR